MLERTAGCLESGSLRRLLPASRTTVKSRRRLHSGFWSHGAGDELSSLWTVLVRGAETVESQDKEKRRMGATSNPVLLDFLYPAEALNLIRKYSSWGGERQDNNWTRSWLGKAGRRQYTSSAKDNGSDTHADPHHKGFYEDMDILYKKFELERKTDYAEAWRQYSLLEEDEQLQYRGLVIEYLGTSNRIVDAERVTELFGMLEDEQKRVTTYRNTIGAFLKLRNMSDAMEVFHSGAKSLGSPVGSEILFAHFIRGWDWLNATNLWEEVQAINQQNDGLAAHYNMYAEFDKMKDVADHILQLEKFVRDTLRDSAKALSSAKDREYGFEGDPSAIDAVDLSSHRSTHSFRPSSKEQASTSETEFEGTSKSKHESTEDQIQKIASEVPEPDPATTNRRDSDKQGPYSLTLTGISISPNLDSSSRVTSNRSEPETAGVDGYDFLDMEKAIAENAKLLQFAASVIRRYLYKAEIFNGRSFITLLRSLWRWNLLSAPDFASALDHLFYMGEKQLVPVCYYMARNTDSFWLGKLQLHHVLDVFVSDNDVLGIRRVIDDFFSLHNGPTQLAYRVCMKAFSNLGDDRTVIALFEQFSARYRKVEFNSETGLSTRSKDLTANDFAPILHVYAKRGEVKEVLRVLAEIEELYGLQPSIMCWNILLNAYGRVQNYEEACNWFEKLLTHSYVKPDKYTLGTMMGLSAKHGDFQDLIEMVQLADEMQIEMGTNFTLDCLVQAHLRNGHAKQAETICEEAQSMAKYNGPTTRMWNELLIHYANRGDVDGVNRILQKMNILKVPYDRATYGSFMQAIAMVGLASHAWRVLTKVMPKAGFKPSRANYATVMGAYITSGQYREVFRVQEEMQRAGFEPSASTSLLAVKSLVHEQDLDSALKVFASTMSTRDVQDLVDMPRKGDSQLPLDIAYTSMYYNFMIYVLGTSKNYDSADELYKSYRRIMPSDKQDPINVCSAVMFVAAGKQDWDRVEKFWQFAFSEAVRISQPLPTRKIISKYRESQSDPRLTAGAQPNTDEDTKGPATLPKYRLSLARALQIYMNALITQEDSKKVVLTVSRMHKAGFALDYRNWNRYISELSARWKYPKDAFLLCEKWLMPGWLGWPRLQRKRWTWERQLKSMQNTKFFQLRPRPLELQRKLRRNDYLRPRTSTLLDLQKAYQDLEFLAIEDAQAEAVLKEINELCPQTMKAINKFPYGARPGVELLREKYLTKRKLFPGA